ncbi:cell division protein FtsZ [Aquirufa antheringensis]|jgi:cell division protein FtsZ|uniref:Cell division protein FtsZ n=1 Tax=Aquirufa antheringensis TaxID=2516559 RepID=A0A4Q9BAC7_9BACT|nr:cell division protein FtsZ [Aquirufa antheringensis]MCE4215859.1 cell division protein FtsZ [Pseudarcicella sp. GAP-15]MCZ2485316.1 cell division protein FtsZ [Aquirufa antheringensis]MCZ2488287.1 cell division protein FtsZ [Aquirufa antheringensis]MCZ2490170.1 cell division protein FtsZ [Aquirufa antheringensis]TBH70211.1 cell division protein FtsZ [Aquirufa antheringensis]
MSSQNPSFFNHQIEVVPETSFKSIIKVIGIGGGGSNAVKHMDNLKIKGADLIICNTDSQALASNTVRTKIKLGEQGLGAGTDPEVGKQAAQESQEKIKAVLSNETKMVFITAGMGGGTGTGAAPVVAEIARDRDLLTVAVVSFPYNWEGKEKIQYARDGIEELKAYCDTVLVIMNDKISEHYKDLAVKHAFAKADDVLAKAVKSVVDVIAKPGDINTDFMDVKKVLTNAGQAMMSSALGKGEERAKAAIVEALNSPLLNSQEIKGAKRILVTVSTSSEKDLLIWEKDAIIEYLNERIDAQADMVKFGFSTDEELGDDLYLTVIAAGFEQDSSGMDGGMRKVVKKAAPVFLNPGDSVELDGELETATPAAADSEEARFALMIEKFKNGNVSDTEFKIPTYKRTEVGLYDITTMPEKAWQTTDLFAE